MSDDDLDGFVDDTVGTLAEAWKVMGGSPLDPDELQDLYDLIHDFFAERLEEAYDGD